MRSFSKLVLPLVSLTLFAACAEQAPLVPEKAQAEVDAGAVMQAAETARSTSEFFLQVLQAVPGFAGLTYEDGIPTAYLTQPEQAASAQATLEPFLEQQGKGGRGFRVRPATYTWGQLYAWRMKARALLSIHALTALGASVTQNRVVIGIAPGSDPGNVRKRLADLGIPDAAVEIGEADPVPTLSELTDRLRPVMGGIRAYGAGTPGGDCTLGFNIMWDGMRTTTTANHCLQPMHSNQHDVVYQPTDSAAYNNRIGEEVADPATVTCSDSLPAYATCQNSDVALLQYDDSVPWSFGHIARTLWPGQYTGSTSINAARSRFWITGSRLWVLVGDTVNKIGWKTGWTQGTVKATDRTRRELGTDIWIVGSDSVDAGADHGDSGSPVFVLGGYGRVTLVGSLWGGWPTAFIFSPLGQMGPDFGNYLDVVTSAPTLPSGVSITGPTRIRPGATCEWDGSVTSGTTPYAYSWTNDRFDVNDDSTVYRGSNLYGGSSFVLEFTVTNDAGSSSMQLTVQEDSTAAICPNAPERR